MNTAKMTLTSTILAAALGLALGLAVAPAMAGPPDAQGCHPDHKVEECPVSGGEDPTIFDVVLEFLEIPGGTVGDQTRVVNCMGDTDILANPGLTVNFDSGCFVKMHRTSSGAEVEMHLFRLEVKTKGSGIIEIVLNFTTEPEGLTGANLGVTLKINGRCYPTR